MAADGQQYEPVVVVVVVAVTVVLVLLLVPSPVTLLVLVPFNSTITKNVHIPLLAVLREQLIELIMVLIKAPAAVAVAVAVVLVAVVVLVRESVNTYVWVPAASVRSISEQPPLDLCIVLVV